jgi:hypothetical protein
MNFELQMILLLGLTVFFVGFGLYGSKQDKKKKEQEARRLQLLENQRKALIKTKVKNGEWTTEEARSVYKKSVGIDMTEEMVKTSWGEPSDIDKIEILKSGIRKERWVYGIPRRGAEYIHFKEGKVIKIQGS